MDVKLWLKRHKLNKAGKAPISIRLTINGKRAEISSKIRVYPDQWDAARQVVIGTKAARLLNDELDIQVAKLRLLKSKLDGLTLTAAVVAAANKPQPVTEGACLLAALDTALTTHYCHGNQQTYASFLRAAALLKQWHAIRHPNTPNLPKDAFTKEARQDFTRHLLQTLTPAGIRTYRIALTAMWVRAGVYTTEESPFIGLKLPKHTPKARASLSREQLKLLRTGPLSYYQHNARNLYMACFYLHGSRILAVLQLRWKDYDGLRIKYQAMKGGPLKSVVVGAGLHSILSEYENTNPNHFIFPYLPHDYFELPPTDRYKRQKAAVAAVGFHLRKACYTLGLPSNIHPHTARHTMARMTVEANQGDIRAAQHVLGHSNYRQTEAYVRGMLTTEIDTAASAVYDNLD